MKSEEQQIVVVFFFFEKRKKSRTQDPAGPASGSLVLLRLSNTNSISHAAKIGYVVVVVRVLNKTWKGKLASREREPMLAHFFRI